MDTIFFFFQRGNLKLACNYETHQNYCVIFLSRCLIITHFKKVEDRAERCINDSEQSGSKYLAGRILAARGLNSQGVFVVKSANFLRVSG